MQETWLSIQEIKHASLSAWGEWPVSYVVVTLSSMVLVFSLYLVDFYSLWDPYKELIPEYYFYHIQQYRDMNQIVVYAHQNTINILVSIIQV